EGKSHELLDVLEVHAVFAVFRLSYGRTLLDLSYRHPIKFIPCTSRASGPTPIATRFRGTSVQSSPRPRSTAPSAPNRGLCACAPTNRRNAEAACSLFQA